MDPAQTFGTGKLNEFLEVDELVDRIGLTEQELDWRKHFIGFDADDERRLADLEDLLRDNQTAIADDFYENLLGYEGTRTVIERSPKDVNALKQTQSAYLVSLSTGDYDQEFFANRARIGKLHELLDMPLKHYIGQYGVYYDLLLEQLNERIQEQVIAEIETWAAEQNETEETEGGLGGLAGALGFGGGSESQVEDDQQDGLEESFEATVRDAIDDGLHDVLSLLRIINLDMQIATETYVDSYAQDLEDSIERRKRLARDVEEDVQGPIEELHDASEEIAERAVAISEHTESQAEDTNQAATELGELSAAIEEVASTTDAVSEESERTERLASNGASAATEALEELEQIEAATEDVAKSAAALEERTDEIDAVLERLDEVAERTAVLAKNAKIEATRSGADGSAGGDASGNARTMGVIAEEVESFAAQTRRDLESIETAVEGVREDALETVDATDRTVERVDRGADRVRDSMADLEEIHDAARETAARMDDVAAATDQQARNVQRAAATVEDVAESADEVAAAAQSVAAASQEQTASLESVGEAVSRLTDAEPGTTRPVYERLG
ncbi:globin-coupled sensor protein [Natronolimnohabitans innermongolicus]|uniref:Chemotaxis sensory transducer n=1 Tax=Natronolimnohabitans innermongolicus JCM 12255 TaxID=1227499 RepID=L9WX02_9EURY|nr:globin-coupled sensor protein [Natronolimnohabitans innermongolicus]ELY53989.1 chemotaxis sensory transducer [Natronolimnohabitans innermongolicus JCM 12255]